MATRYNYTGGIVTNGLVLNLDAAKTDSYPGTGTTWRDLSGFGNNGTLVNGPTFSGIGKQASIVFDASNDYASLSNFTVTTSLTFNVFINISSYTGVNPDTGVNPGFWRSDTALNACNGKEFNIFQSDTGLPWIRWNGSEILRPNSGYSVPLNTWVYLSYVVENGGPGCYFYVNGELKHSNTHSQSITSFPIRIFGCQCNLVEKIAGKYANVSFYNRALSAQEVLQNFNATKGRFGLS
jgi:hypothetical protein